MPQGPREMHETRTDPALGQKLFSSKCGKCHGLDAKKKGPPLRGVVGRKAGESPGYSYSDALKASGVTWTAETIDTWLTNSKAMVAGTKMGVKLPAASDRANIIAYLGSPQ